MTNINYAPPGPISQAFMDSEAFVRGIMGPFGSGKSTLCIFNMLKHATLQPPGEGGIRRSRWAAIRNNYPELRTTTITTWHQWIPPTMGRWVGEGPPRHFLTWKLPDKTTVEFELWFLALDRPDDISKLLSMELTGSWINEAREVPKAVLDGLTGRVGRFPSAMQGGRGWSGIIMDTNPPDEDHWWYKLAEEDKPDGFQFFRQPGGLSPNAENRENLPEGYYERQIAGKSQDWIRVYVDAQYGFVRTGKPVWADYNDQFHCREFDLYADRPIYVGIDFGLTPAAALLQISPKGQVRIFDEIVATGMGMSSFAPLLKQRLAGEWKNYRVGAIHGDPAGIGKAQSDETTCFDILRAHGISALPAQSNDPTLRIDSVGDALRRIVDGEPALLLHPRCRMLRKAMAGKYAYKRVNVSGEERFKEEPDKNDYSHISDGLQYAFDAAGLWAKLVTSESRPQSSRVRAQNWRGR